MNGFVDAAGRALVDVEIRASADTAPRAVSVWIDTGFTGDLVLPRTLIHELALAESGTVGAILADGSQVVLQTYECAIEWFGVQKQLQVVANDGEYPLLGVGMLLGRDLYVGYGSGTIAIE